MIRVIGGGGEPPEGLKEFLGLVGGGADEKNVSVPGDIAMLAERAVERNRRQRFEPGDFVQMRAPEGLGLRNTGPYIVIRVFEEPVSVHQGSSAWESHTFSHTDADVIVGMIMRSNPQGSSAYREIYTWSGLLAPYELNDDEQQMAEIGRESANHSPKPKQPEVVDDEAAAVAAVKPALRQNPWGTASEG